MPVDISGLGAPSGVGGGHRISGLDAGLPVLIFLIREMGISAALSHVFFLRVVVEMVPSQLW